MAPKSYNQMAGDAIRYKLYTTYAKVPYLSKLLKPVSSSHHLQRSI
jgi:hypothetical protein